MRMDIHGLDSLATNDDLAAAMRMHMPRTAARTSTGVNLTVDKGQNRAGIYASANRHFRSSHSYDNWHWLQELSNILNYCNRLGVKVDCSACQKTAPESCKPFRRCL